VEDDESGDDDSDGLTLDKWMRRWIETRLVTLTKWI